LQGKAARSVPVRNARLDGIEACVGVSAIVRILTGPKPANCAASDRGGLLGEYDLASDWADAAAAGAKVFFNPPITSIAIAAGVSGYFRFYDDTSTVCHSQGTITATGGGGNLTVENPNVAIGQNLNIVALTRHMPGGLERRALRMKRFMKAALTGGGSFLKMR